MNLTLNPRLSIQLATVCLAKGCLSHMHSLLINYPMCLFLVVYKMHWHNHSTSKKKMNEEMEALQKIAT